jgi:DNA-binding beta-propeller fold protein YncE
MSWVRATLAPLGLASSLLACTAAESEVRPPQDELFFPTGVAVSPDESVLFALSANSELRWDSGTVTVFDLAAVDDVVAAWTADRTIPEGCAQDPGFAELLVCPESAFAVAGAGVRIGNFATSIGVQDKGGGDLRLVIPVRGDPSVTWVDWDAAARRLRCSDAEGFALCDEAHRLTRFRNDPALPQLADEPFGVFVDSGGAWAVVTHITTGTASLVDLPVDGAPVLSDALSGLFAADAIGRRGAAAVAGRTPGAPDDLVYVTSLSESRVQTFTVERTQDVAGGLARLVPGPYFFLKLVGALAGASSDTRGVAFGGGGDVGYFLNREPPSVAVVDTSIGPQGTPRNEVVGATDVCREASGLAVADTGDGERAYVTCFQAGELQVVDPRGRVDVVAVAPLGRGAFSAAAAPGRRRLYVSNFFDDALAVVDLAPGSATRNRVVLRIGALPE